MITKEKVVEILEQQAYRSAAAGRIVVYETSFEDIAEEVVKNCSIPAVVGQSEQLPCGDLIKHNFSLSKIGRCITCDRSKDKAR